MFRLPALFTAPNSSLVLSRITLFIGLCLFLIFNVSNAQETPVEPKETEEEQIERIEVSGRAGDAAMQAFNAGNFELAEIKFQDNARCAQRAQRSKEAFVESLQNSQINETLSGDAGSNGAASGVADAGNGTLSQSTRQNRRNDDPVRERTCNNRGFQVYMMGMSQLQMGRAEEAEENFESAIRLNRHLYDAMHRLALMKLLREDKEGAQDHFSSMQSLLKRCNKCDARNEIQIRLDFLEKALDGRIKLK